jgi:hypothetical protein
MDGVTSVTRWLLRNSSNIVIPGERISAERVRLTGPNYFGAKNIETTLPENLEVFQVRHSRNRNEKRELLFICGTENPSQGYLSVVTSDFYRLNQETLQILGAPWLGDKRSSEVFYELGVRKHPSNVLFEGWELQVGTHPYKPKKLIREI